jgi:hypothetical protein
MKKQLLTLAASAALMLMLAQPAGAMYREGVPQPEVKPGEVSIMSVPVDAVAVPLMATDGGGTDGNTGVTFNVDELKRTDVLKAGDVDSDKTAPDKLPDGAVAKGEDVAVTTSGEVKTLGVEEDASKAAESGIVTTDAKDDTKVETTSATVEKEDNKGMYVSIGIGVVALLAVGAFVFTRSRKKGK